MWPHQAPTCSPRWPLTGSLPPGAMWPLPAPGCVGRAGQAGAGTKNTHFGADRLGLSSPLPRRCGEPAGISLKWRRALERSGSSGTGSLFLDKRQGEGLGASRGGGRSCRARAGACMWGRWGPPTPSLPWPSPATGVCSNRCLWLAAPLGHRQLAISGVCLESGQHLPHTAWESIWPPPPNTGNGAWHGQLREGPPPALV